MDYNDKDRYVEMLGEVVIKVVRNLEKSRKEFCPCRFDASYHKPSDIVNCGHANFHAPELLYSAEYTYAIGCLNQFIDKNPDYIADDFFIKTAEHIANDKVSALHAMREVKNMLYKHILEK